MSELPTAIWEGSFTLFGVDVKCYVLEDGQRLIEAKSMENMIAAMALGVPLVMHKFDAFSLWQSGKYTPPEDTT